MCVKFPSRPGTAWNLHPKSSRCEQRPVPRNGTYIGRMVIIIIEIHRDNGELYALINVILVTSLLRILKISNVSTPLRSLKISAIVNDGPVNTDFLIYHETISDAEKCFLQSLFDVFFSFGVVCHVCYFQAVSLFQSFSPTIR